MSEEKRDVKQPGEKKKRAPQSNRFAKLLALKCFPEVKQHLIAGFSLPQVSEFIQEERKEYTDVTRSSLITILSRYRREMPPLQILENMAPSQVSDAMARFKKGEKELDRLESLYEFQLRRLEIGHATEIMMNRLLNRVTLEVDQTLRIIAKMHSVKMDLGVGGGRDLGTLHIDDEKLEKIEESHGPEVRAAMEDPESRVKVLNLAHALRKRAEKQGITGAS